MTTKFLRLNPTAERVGWGPKHTMRVATEPEYEHLGFPKPVRVSKNTIAFVESEIEQWLQARVAERDEQGFEPKAVNPRENHRRAKERQLAGASA